MSFPHIMAEIARTPWAIAPSALRGIVSAVQGELDASDYSAFHAADPDMAQAISAQLGSKVPGTRSSFVRSGIGALQINGPIVPRGDAFTDVSGLASVDRLTLEFRALEMNPEVSKILLVIDSPGGAITGISEFAAMVAASEKPTAVYVYGMAASAAYWIASAADEIIVADTGLTGSIGVVLTLWKADENEIEIVSSQSPHKRDDPATEDGAKQLQYEVDGLAEVFISTVARNRGKSAKAVAANFGRGGMVLPADAIRAGMIDGQMTLANYLAILTGAFPAFPDPVATLISDDGDEQDDGDGPGEKDEDENKLFDTPATEVGKENNGAAPAAGGAKDMAMTNERNLTEAEIDAIRAQAYEEGRATATAAANERNARATKILLSDYPAPIKAIAAAVVDGSKSPETLDVFVEVFDSLKAQALLDGAMADSDAAPATPGQNTTPISNDGVLRTAADIDAAAAAAKAGR